MAKKKKNKLPPSPQLIPGDYEHPLLERENQWGARKIFLDLLPQWVPQTIDKLRISAYEPFLQFKERMTKDGIWGAPYSSFDPTTNTLEFIWFLYGEYEKKDERTSQQSSNISYTDPTLSKALLDWAIEFHIVADWVLDAALLTMDRWSRRVKERGFHVIRRPSFHNQELVNDLLDDVPLPFVFRHSGWNPFLRKEVEIKEEIRKDFEERLNNYIASMKGIAESYKTPPEIENRSRDGSPYRHTEWFIRNRVLGNPYKTIGETLPQPGGEKSPANRVRYGVKKIAKLLDFKD